MTQEPLLPSPQDVGKMIRQHRGWFMFEGVVFILLGIAAILFPLASSLAVEIFLGVLFVVGGGVTGVRALAAKGMRHRGTAFLLSLITLAAGVFLLIFVGAGVLALTLVLSVFFLVEGGCVIAQGVRTPAGSPGRGWMIVNGIVGLVVGLLVWLGWPSSSAWVLGTLAGVDFIFSGVTLLSMGGGAGSPDLQAAA